MPCFAICLFAICFSFVDPESKINRYVSDAYYGNKPLRHEVNRSGGLQNPGIEPYRDPPHSDIITDNSDQELTKVTSHVFIKGVESREKLLIPTAITANQTTTVGWQSVSVPSRLTNAAQLWLNTEATSATLTRCSATVESVRGSVESRVNLASIWRAMRYARSRSEERLPQLMLPIMLLDDMPSGAV